MPTRAVFDFKDDEGRPRKPTAAEYLAIQREIGNMPPDKEGLTGLGDYPSTPDVDPPTDKKLLTEPAGGLKFDEGAMLGSVSKALEGITASQQREQGIYERHAPVLEARRKDYEAEVARQQANMPTPPTPGEKIPVPTRAQYSDPTIEKSLFAVASLFAGLGMAGGRGRGMLAMAGLRGAMQGYNKEKLENYEAGMKKYKLQMNKQIKAFDEQYKSYMAILNSNRLTLEEKIRMYDLEATRQQDELGREAANRKEIGEMIKHATDIYKMQYESEKALAQAQDLPAKRAHDLKMRQYQEDIAKARLDYANRVQANTKQQTLLKDAIRIEQKSLDQLQKEEKGLHSIWDYFGASNKPLKSQQKIIEDKKKKIDNLQSKLETIATEGAGLRDRKSTR